MKGAQWPLAFVSARHTALRYGLRENRSFTVVSSKYLRLHLIQALQQLQAGECKMPASQSQEILSKITYRSVFMDQMINMMKMSIFKLTYRFNVKVIRIPATILL